MKIVFRIMLVLMIMMMTINFWPNIRVMANSSAPGGGGGYSGDILQDARDWFSHARSSGAGLIEPSVVAEKLKPVSQILFWAGVIVLTIAYPVMGIKYMISEPDKKADLKTKLIGLVVASIVIFGAYGIWKISYIFMNEVVN